MPRLMSVTLTEQAVVERRKTVTRRLGWTHLKPGDELDLCRKVMGRRRPDGTVEPLVRLARVRVVSTRWERLDEVTAEDVAREGFDLPDLERPEANARWFVQFFCDHMRCTPGTPVNRIEWEYL